MDTALLDGPAARAFTLKVLTRIADPVLNALAENRLHARMPVEGRPYCADFSHLEAISRLLVGLAPWLELGPEQSEEGKLRAHYAVQAVQSIRHATDPAAPDYMNFGQGRQPLVDSAFLAHALIRAPKELWEKLAPAERGNVVAALKLTRKIEPAQNNWLLFSAMVEAALWTFTGEGELAAIETAVARHLEWYQGDGTYGDGPAYRWDYYNSFVIQPMLLDIVRLCAQKRHPLGEHFPALLKRAQRYAAVQEQMISPEGTFPVIGRSSCYRFGAFQLLSQLAWQRELRLPLGAVRAGLTAVIRRMIEAPGTFDAAGWLRPGVVGHQPAMADPYISTGSLYLCTAGLLHLGLPADDPFWTVPDEPWTQRRIWSGEDLPGDHSLEE